MITQTVVSDIQKLHTLPWEVSFDQKKDTCLLDAMLENWAPDSLCLAPEDIQPLIKQHLKSTDLNVLISSAIQALSDHTWSLPPNSDSLFLTGTQRIFLNHYLINNGYPRKPNVEVLRAGFKQMSVGSDEVLSYGDWLGFYAAPAIAAKHLLQQPLISISKAHHNQPGNPFYCYQLPEYWSKEQAFWAFSRQPPFAPVQGQKGFIADRIEFDFLLEAKIAYGGFGSVNQINFPQPFKMRWHELLGMDAHRTSLYLIEQEMRVLTFLLLILCVGLTLHADHREFATECYLNLKKMEQGEVFRAYANLMTLHSSMKLQDWVLADSAHALMTLFGIKPMFHIKIDDNTPHITERLIKQGYVPRLECYQKIQVRSAGASPFIGMQTTPFLQRINRHASSALSVLHTPSTPNPSSVNPTSVQTKQEKS